MKKKFSFSLILCLFLTIVIQAQVPKEDNSEYRQLVKKVRSGDKDVNFGLIRKAYADWISDDSNVTEAPQRDEMVSAFEKKDYATAVKLGEVVVDYEILNRGLLLAMENAYRQLKNTEKADFHRDLALKAGHSLYLSGDGKTPQTAYYVVDISEEYKLMREFNYSVSSQSLVSSEGQMFDVLTGKDEKENAVKVYFNICSFFSGCSKKKPK